MCPEGTQVNAHREQKYNRSPAKQTVQEQELELMQPTKHTIY